MPVVAVDQRHFNFVDVLVHLGPWSLLARLLFRLMMLLLDLSAPTLAVSLR